MAFTEPLAFTPGEDFSYSNIGYAVLVAIIEKVSGRTSKHFCGRIFFIPPECFLPVGRCRNGKKGKWHTGMNQVKMMARCEPCRRGNFFACVWGQVTGLTYDGGYAEYMIAHASAVARRPEKLSAIEASPLVCAGITMFNSMRNSGARPGDLVAILGFGGLGHLRVQFAAKMGFKTVAIARGSDKESFARELGAHHYIDSQKVDVAAELSKMGGAKVILATVTDNQAMTATLDGTFLSKPYPDWNFVGAGDLLSTTGDMYRWHQALIGDRVLSAAAKKKLYAEEKNNYGYGWVMRKTDQGLLLEHNGGSSDGSACQFYRFIDQGVTIMIFSNMDGEGILLGSGLREHVRTLALGGDVAPPPEVKVSDGEKLKRFTGKYLRDDGNKIIVELERGILMVRGMGQSAVNALLPADEQEKSARAEVNTETERTLAAVIEGDRKPLEEAVARKESAARYERNFKEALRKRRVARFYRAWHRAR